MADQFPTVKLDASKLANYDKIIPTGVRNSLRTVLPGILRDLGARVDQILDTELQSRTNLKVSKTIREDRSGVYGQITMKWIGDGSKVMVPNVIETGSKAHAIVAKNAPALSFLWPKMGGGRFFFKRVWHPGYRGIHPVMRAYQAMQPEINDRLFTAVYNGLYQLTLAPASAGGTSVTKVP